MPKKLWLTFLPGKDQQALLTPLMDQLTKYGLHVDGGFWDDNLEKFGWTAHAGPLKDPDKADVWLVAGQRDQWKNPDIQYGLSCLCLGVKQARGAGFPAFLLGMGVTLSEEDLPTALKGARIFTDTDPTWPAKILAAAHKPQAPLEEPYRISVHANEYFGQWFEIGPSKGEWAGAMFGIDQGEITHHGVGPAGFPPERSVVEYSWRGLKLEVGGREFTAWALQNRIGEEESYFVKVAGNPATLIFGDHPEIGSGEAYVFSLKRG